MTAYGSSNKYAPIAQRWTSALLDYSPTWSAFAAVVGKEGDSSLQVYHDLTIGELSGSWTDGGAIPDGDVGSGPVQTITASGKGLKVTLKRGDIVRDSTLISRKSAELVNAAKREIEKAVYTSLDTSPTTAYSVGGGLRNYLSGTGDPHPLEDGVTTQFNDLNAALANDSLEDARVTLRRWKNFGDGSPLGLGAGPLVLVVPPDLEGLANRITGSASMDHDSTVGILNPHSQRNYTVISSPYLTSTTEWFLIDPMAAPVKVFAPVSPHLAIEEQAADQQTVISVTMEIAAFIEGPPDGLVGSSA
jgi:hypothetical protein